ncbi:MAG: porin family protein [Bacteroidales bacterium]|nr:porin family protein [Bacteroidales bacterium]MDP2236541.1 porin family protein [Bacteroidales bacterium]
MKNILLLSFSILILSHLSFAQNFKGGVNAGLAISQIAGDGLSGYNKAGIHTGFFVNYLVKPNVAVQMELAYIQKGSAQSENPDNPQGFQFLRRLNYIELPLLLQYQLKPLLLEVGVSADFLAGTYEEINYQFNEQPDVWRKSTLNTVLGVKYMIGNNLMINIRTTNSINSIRKNTVPLNVRRYTKTYGEYNDVITFGLSYQF